MFHSMKYIDSNSTISFSFNGQLLATCRGKYGQAYLSFP